MPTSPWESDYTNKHVDLQQLRTERSTSAPPLFFGAEDTVEGDSFIGSRMARGDDFDRLFDDRGGSARSLFLDAEAAKGRGRSTMDRSLSGLSPDFSSRGGSLDQFYIGESITRSRSAAPSFDGGMTLGPPPGLENRQTPLASNLSRDSYLDRDQSRLFHLGQRRPASTGVIGSESLGLGSTNGGAVRPAAKTLMDLIQEDFPPELNLGSFQSDYPRETYMERTRPSSPMPPQLRLQPTTPSEGAMGSSRNDDLSRSFDRFRISQMNEYGNMDQNRPIPQHQPMNAQFQPGLQQAQMIPQHINQQNQMTSQQHLLSQGQVLPNGQMQSHGQLLSQNHGLSQNDSMQGSMYPMSSSGATNSNQNGLQAQSLMQTQQPQFQQPQYEQQTTYGEQHQLHRHVQTHMLPSGQTVYVNAQPQHSYGYPSVQYHQQTQQPHMVHHAIPGTMPSDAQQYLSVVSMQGGGGPMQTLPPGRTYAFWQPDGQTGGQTLTILNPHGPHGIPIATTQGGEANGEQKRRHQRGPPHHGGTRGKEKGGKPRRGEKGPGRSKTSSSQSYDSVLEEFKSKKNNRDWTVYRIEGHVVDFCQDQNGSRFLQQRIEVGDIGEKQIVLREVLSSIPTLRNDVFGNYVVQKLLDFGTPSMRAAVHATMEGEMLQLSLQMYGCRVVQKALETLDELTLSKLLAEFQNHVLSCVHDQNGNHVIQKCVEVVSERAKQALSNGDELRAKSLTEQIDFIVDDVLRNVISLSCHPYGCRVLQRIVEHCIEPEKNMALNEIKKHHRTLLGDQYGNYVIQHVLQFGRCIDRDSILQIVIENGLLLLSTQKFASNVVEKLLKYGNDDQRRAVVREMLKHVDESTGGAPQSNDMQNCSVALLMVRDPYANYVVQTTLDVISDSEEKRLLLAELNSHSAELKSYTFAKHIVMKLEA